MRDALSPVHVACLRWTLLETVEAADVLAATEVMCRNVAAAAYPGISVQRVRKELDYLEAGGLVTLERDEIRPWRVRLTSVGRDVTDYAVAAPAGIVRPPPFGDR